MYLVYFYWLVIHKVWYWACWHEPAVGHVSACGGVHLLHVQVSWSEPVVKTCHRTWFKNFLFFSSYSGGSKNDFNCSNVGGGSGEDRKIFSCNFWFHSFSETLPERTYTTWWWWRRCCPGSSSPSTTSTITSHSSTTSGRPSIKKKSWFFTETSHSHFL